MKKLTAILLALTMIFAFAACGSTPDEEEVRGEQNVNTTEASNTTENLTTAPTEDVTDAPSVDVTDAPQGDVIDTPTEETTEAEFSLGDVEGLNYENKFIGIGCNLPSDWTFYTDEQIRELNNIATDYFDEEYQEIIANAQLVYDMYAITGDQLKNINVNLEKVNPTTLSMVDLADIYEQNEAVFKQTFENMGYTNITFEHGTVMIEDQSFASFKTTAQINGIDAYQLLFSTKCNGYIANFAITTYAEDATDDVLSYFYLIK